MEIEVNRRRRRVAAACCSAERTPGGVNVKRAARVLLN
jgi:hypothetical protein